MRREKVICKICIVLYIFIFMNGIAHAETFGKNNTQGYANSYKENTRSTIDEYLKRYFNINKGIKRIEFVYLLNWVYGFNDKAHITFKDIAVNSKDGEEVAKAVSAGYMLGYGDNTFGPERELNKQEVAAIVFRLMKLDNMSEQDTTSDIKDLGKIPEWSREAIYAVIRVGYMTVDENNFNPAEVVTREEITKLLNILIGTLINKSGDYGKEEIWQDIEGNVTINTTGINMYNKTIKGDLYIAAGVGDGSIKLKNVRVTGRTIIGGASEVFITETSRLGEIIIDKKSGEKLYLTAATNSKTGNISIRSAVFLSEEDVTGLAFGEVTIDKMLKTKETIVFDGDFTTITSNAQGINIFISEGSMVGTLTLNSRANVTGGGIIGTVNLNSNDSVLTQVPGRINSGEGVKNSQATGAD